MQKNSLHPSRPIGRIEICDGRPPGFSMRRNVRGDDQPCQTTSASMMGMPKPSAKEGISKAFARASNKRRPLVERPSTSIMWLLIALAPIQHCSRFTYARSARPDHNKFGRSIAKSGDDFSPGC